MKKAGLIATILLVLVGSIAVVAVSVGAAPPADTIPEMLNRIDAKISAIQAEIATIEGSMTDARAANLDLLPGVSEQVTGLKDALAEIKAEIAVVEGRLTEARAGNLDLLPGINDDVTTIEGRLTEARAANLDLLPGIGTDTSTIGATVANLDAKVNNLTTQIQSIANDVASIESQIGGAVHMATIQNNATVSKGDRFVYSIGYTGIRHVSLMVQANLDEGDSVGVIAAGMGVESPYIANYFVGGFSNESTGPYWKHYEFDAQSWGIRVIDSGGSGSQVWYTATVTWFES